ncbi:N-acetylmuramoyl-L-alanine amidase [Thalassospira sp. HJ]|uniref:N-acetylmuramoyl-L-alanine amidase n=1 Tax=Thalassospira sp. HJ TaxID=1616823 RepID=UPI0005CEFD47|nr:N-acetylmuramoyl-L-alanine amidase [Thalassospira sp. HJ]KJE35974.1 N-acetylmuramoyl-L-alanine amidase [Thalassospira sp. HJ]
MKSEIIKHPSPNFGPRPGDCPIDILVLHYTGMQSGAAALNRLCDRESSVSSHYLIEEDGRIFQLVDEDKRAWHAGVGAWQDCHDINSHSIGIEIVNPGHEFGYRAFPSIQITSIIALCQDILGRHPIPASRIIAHSDMAPDRKTDPGELFPWDELAKHGIGLWPQSNMSFSQANETSKINNETIQDLLSKLGYRSGTMQEQLLAFQRHWHKEELTGLADAATLRCLMELVSCVSKTAI